MRRSRFVIVASAVMASVWFGGRVFSQAPAEEKKPAEPPAMQMPSPEQMAEMMKKWQATMSPGEHHKKLTHFVGEWNTTMKMFMGGPGGPATESKGASKIKWVLDGRFTQEEFSGEMKMPGPDGKEMVMPFKGLGLTGYDNYQNMYVASWADTNGTQLLSMKGGCDPSGKVFTFYGEMDEPMLDVRGRLVKYVTRIIDDKKHVLEIYDLHAGPDYKVLEIAYERK